MGKTPLSKEEIDEIMRLRKNGHSISEIRKIVPRGKASIFKYMKNVEVVSPYKEILKAKQGGSKYRSSYFWNAAKLKANRLISDLTVLDKVLILTCLYWGEGNKNELSLINGDPCLVKVFVAGLLEIGVKKSDLKVTLRLYDDLSKHESIRYWANVLEIEKSSITNVNVMKGKKNGKLKYGMCRVRVCKSQEYFKLIISMIDLLRFSFNAPVVQRIEQPRPKW